MMYMYMYSVHVHVHCMLCYKWHALYDGMKYFQIGQNQSIIGDLGLMTDLLNLE